MTVPVSVSYTYSSSSHLPCGLTYVENIILIFSFLESGSAKHSGCKQPPLFPMSESFSFFEIFQKQIFFKIPVPQTKFAGQTIIVTGANSGMGLEAVRHLVRLDAAKVILAVRNLSKGESAAEDVRTTTNCRPDVLEVWHVDFESAASVVAFAKRVNTELDRLDVFLANAGVYGWDYHEVDGNERMITVNVVNTLLVGILVIPKLRETSVKFNKETVLTFNGSMAHSMTNFPERKSDDIFGGLRIKDQARIGDRQAFVSPGSHGSCYRADLN